MTIEEIEQIELEHGVTFAIKPEKGTIAATATTGDEDALDRALGWAAAHRAEVVPLLRQRQGIVEQKVEREISAKNVPSLAVQRSNYVRWYVARSPYYHPDAEQLDLMFAAVEEGDELIFDFAHSFTVRKPNGLLVQVDRKGRVSAPSPYSPAVKQ